MSDTKIGYTFRNYAVPEGSWGKIATADDIRFTYLWGIDLKAADVIASEIADNQLEFCIDSALAAFENDFNIDIRKRVYKVDPAATLRRGLLWTNTIDYTDEEAPYDFKITEWQNFGFIQLRHRPVLSVESAWLYDRLNNKVLNISDWIRLYKKAGQLQIFPKRAFMTGGSGSNPNMFYAGWPGMFDASYPQGFKIEYTTGFYNSDFVPWDLREAIMELATMLFLSIAADGIMAGFSSSSLSLDGLSESFSSTQSPENTYFGARFHDMVKKLDDFRKHNKYKYCNIPMGFVGR